MSIIRKEQLTNPLSASYALTASYALSANVAFNTSSLLVTASVDSNVITFTKGNGSSFDITIDTGSVAPMDTSSLVTTASFNAFTSSINQFTSSYNTGSFTGSFTGNFTGTASWAEYVVNERNIDTSSFATTGSNTFVGDQIINGENLGFIVDASNLKRVGFMKYGGFEGSIARVADQNFRILRTTGSNINDGTNAITDFYIAGDGKVGIGTTTPAYTLDVSGSSNFIGDQTITGSLYQSGTFYPDQIDWFSSSIGYNTGSYILTTTSDGLTTYANYQDVANTLVPYIPTVNLSGYVTTSSFNNFTSSYNTGSFSGSFSGSFYGTSSWATNTLTASYVNPLVQNVTITGSLLLTQSYITSVDHIDFNTSSSSTSSIGRIHWDDVDGTLELGLKGGIVKSQLGQGLITRVVNKTNPLVDLLGSNYQVVVVSGAQGQRLAVKLAQANNDANSAGTLGLVAENISRNQEGFIVTVGLLKNIDTRGVLQGETWNDGDILYLSPTVAGQITNIKPQAPQHTVIIGYVEYAHQNNGKIYVKIDNGYEIDELHNVRITTSSLTTGQLLSYSSSVWINTNQLTGSYGITGSLSFQNGGITGSLYGTSSWANNSLTASHLNTLNQNVTLTGSLTITNDLTVLGSQSVQYITSSQLNISTNIITVNTSTPAIRFGGIAVRDSGSLATGLTGSLLWDSEHNVWIYSNPSGALYDGGLLLTGPRNTSGIGNEVGINSGYAAVGDGSHHMTSSAIYSSGSLIRLENNTQITGSLNVSEGITGSLFGTASWAENARTSSYILSSNIDGPLGFDSVNAALSADTAATATLLTSPAVQDLTIDGKFITALSNSNLDGLSRELHAYTGHIIEGTIDGSVSAGDLIYLDYNDNTWYQVDQTTDSSTKILGAYVDSYYVLLEGDIVLDASYITSPELGKSIFISGSARFTSRPENLTSGYIRSIGHIYYNYNDGIATDYWILRFKPSNDWMQIQ